MQSVVIQLYRRIDESLEYCFNIESSHTLAPDEMECLRLILAEGFLVSSVSDFSKLNGENIVEVGPRLNFATAWSSNMVSICQATGLECITRLERSRRYRVADDE
ncbi:MAG: hypothetical protein KJP19_02120, partial [Deltaproteobacteria bacterium]|nr:hypothetical protein [Deltaproteobacteria bacterium]